VKLIKTFKRSSMKDERLSGLAMISIERDMARRLDTTNLINTFATKNDCINVLYHLQVAKICPQHV